MQNKIFKCLNICANRTMIAAFHTGHFVEHGRDALTIHKDHDREM